MLARAQMQTTLGLVLGEHTTHITMHCKMELSNQVQGLVHSGQNGSRQKPISGLVVLHDLNHVARYADQVLLLVDGRVRALGSREEVLRPDLLSEAYQIPLEVLRSPSSGEQVILPVHNKDQNAGAWTGFMV